MVYVQVPDVADALARAEAAGATPFVGPLPDGQGGTFAWLRDPGGNLVGLTAPAPAPAAAPPQGGIGWLDLTVEDAPAVRDFYAAVTGWTPDAVAMDGYDDYAMLDAAGTPVAGVCHARGPNADLPPVWLPYFTVPSLDAALEAARAGGGRLRSGPTSMGGGGYAVLEDPAGACFAVYAAPPPE
jgi:predicted enzyme related to lactoylglutathione lyase